MKAAFSTAMNLLPDLDAMAAELAAAVLSAGDPVTRYVVGERTPKGDAWIYGPYATADAAAKTIEKGLVGIHPGSRLGVFPLVSAPKKPTRRRKEA